MWRISIFRRIGLLAHGKQLHRLCVFFSHAHTRAHTHSHTSLAAIVGARNIYVLPHLAGLKQIDDIVNVDSYSLPMRMLAVVAALIEHMGTSLLYVLVMVDSS